MSKVPTAGATPATTIPAVAGNDELALAAYNQNFENFRALNALMWQIPLIAMTLTGGLWFGVAKVDMPAFKVGLLSIAAVGDLGLMFVLQRLRYIIAEYLTWIRVAYPAGSVEAPGDGWTTRPKTVKRAFQAMLLFAATISIVLLALTVTPLLETLFGKVPQPAAVAWYDVHATELADGYEGLDAVQTHPKLFAMLKGSAPLRVLDVGSGSGRDAAALAALGHHVTAVDPSAKMLRLARALHPEQDVAWVSDTMPELSKERGTYDLVVLSAVWMHVAPVDRARAFARLVALAAPRGRIYMTLRIGPDDAERGMWSVSVDELRKLAGANRATVTDLGTRPDLLGRDDIRWQTVLISRG